MTIYAVRLSSPTDAYFEKRFSVDTDTGAYRNLRSAPEVVAWLTTRLPLEHTQTPVTIRVWDHAADPERDEPAATGSTETGRGIPTEVAVAPDGRGYIVPAAFVDELLRWLDLLSADIDDDADGAPADFHVGIAARLRHDLADAQRSAWLARPDL